MRALILAIASLGISCAGGTTTVPTNTYRASDAPLFDHSIDFVGTPAVVEGEWSGAFEQRLIRADLVAAVRAKSSVVEIVKRDAALRILVRVNERFKGGSPDEIELRVDDERPSYSFVEDSEDRIVREPWIAFIKWESVGGGEAPIPHWHLSPDTPAVRAKIEYLLAAPPPDPNTEVEVVEP